MEQIRQAVERAKDGNVAGVRQPSRFVSSRPAQPVSPAVTDRLDWVEGRFREVTLRSSHLEAHRIVSHDSANPLRKSFDILRTQVLQSMDVKDWQVLAVTSPTAGCGKSVTAINLALSIARQPMRSVLLVDMDLQKPKIGSYLGIPCEHGVLSVIEGRTALSDAIVQASIGQQRFLAMPTEGGVHDSSECISSDAMRRMLQAIRGANRSRTIIIDLPPMLSSDDVMAFLPQIDCVLLVAAVGASTKADIEACSGQLQSTEVVRLVLNKVSEPVGKYY